MVSDPVINTKKKKKRRQQLLPNMGKIPVLLAECGALTRGSGTHYGLTQRELSENVSAVPPVIASSTSSTSTCSSFRKDLQWLLVNTYMPSLIQDGPQCGLVALWMAAHLRQPHLSIDMETVVQTALSRGYTAQGEMFSANYMALLAEEVCSCKAELLSGGLSGKNAATIIRHLWGGQPVLIPYDEDYNHEPCQRSGHRAHWATASGVLLGLDQGSVSENHCQPDPSLPWLYLPSGTSCSCPINVTGLREVYILAKQGKSLRYQLWSLDCVAQSNEQLRTMDPQRVNDGTQYVVPKGGVEAGLAGQAVLLHTRTQEQ
ncbi:hypothetical protein INR49_022107 [Caranx melampygus]|nr:hypothetical protein INR49_022107 [Caranx melampygus]